MKRYDFIVKCLLGAEKPFVPSLNSQVAHE